MMSVTCFSANPGRQLRASFCGRTVVNRLPHYVHRRADLLVVCGKGKGKKSRRMKSPRGGQVPRQGMPPTPPVDPNNEEFVLFVRSRKVPMWYPYSIMKGGWSANALAKSQENEWGKKLYGGALKKNISEALYKDYDKVVEEVRKNYPTLKQAEELQFGFKIRDKSKPADWWKSVDVEALLDQEEVEKSVVDNMKEGIQGLFGGSST